MGEHQSWTIKIKLPKADHLELKGKLIWHKILVSHWDANQLSQEISISTKREYVEAQMFILSESNNLTLIKRILDDNHFPFTYNDNEIKKGNKDFCEPR